MLSIKLQNPDDASKTSTFYYGFHWRRAALILLNHRLLQLSQNGTAGHIIIPLADPNGPIPQAVAAVVVSKSYCTRSPLVAIALLNGDDPSRSKKKSLCVSVKMMSDRTCDSFSPSLLANFGNCGIE